MKEEQGFMGGGGRTIKDLFGSVRQSLNFRQSEEFSTVADRIGNCLRKSRVGLGGFLPNSPSRRLTMGIGSAVKEEQEAPRIRWRKGELIGAGAFGQVFMGMNLDSGELLAVKQVVIGSSGASKEKAQAHIRELEEEVKLLKNLSHRNIVRYLGTVREENTLNILLEFVPGGSISSLLSKFGSFPETVIRMYTKQILEGLDYLHRNKIIHRDIKGANILVDNKGCIKLADFGASKQVAQLATMGAAKSLKGTPYWMAPEVIVQSGYSFSADIWSVGCTVIEMATGKPPWSGQYQEVAALFHVGTTKSHPPIPDHLSSEAKDFLLKCLQEDACLRPSSYELLQHPFVTGELKVAQPLSYGSKESSHDVTPPSKTQSNFGTIVQSERQIWNAGSDDDICQMYDEDEFPVVGSSFNPMSEDMDGWPGKFDLSPEQKMNLMSSQGQNGNFSCNSNNKDFAFPSVGNCEDEDEVTENTIRAFLDEKALDLKKLQTPLFEEFLNNSSNSSTSQVLLSSMRKENTPNTTNQYQPATCHPTDSKLPPVTPTRPIPSGPTTLFRSGSSRAPALSPNQTSRRVSYGMGIGGMSPSRRVSHGMGAGSGRILQEIMSPREMSNREAGQMNNNGAGVGSDLPDATATAVPILTFTRQHEMWKEELVQELEQQREKLGLTTPSRMTSPKDSPLNRKRNRPNNNNTKC